MGTRCCSLAAVRLALPMSSLRRGQVGPFRVQIRESRRAARRHNGRTMRCAKTAWRGEERSRLQSCVSHRDCTWGRVFRFACHGSAQCMHHAHASTIQQWWHTPRGCRPGSSKHDSIVFCKCWTGAIETLARFPSATYAMLHAASQQPWKRALCSKGRSRGPGILLHGHGHGLSSNLRSPSIPLTQSAPMMFSQLHRLGICRV